MPSRTLKALLFTTKKIQNNKIINIKEYNSKKAVDASMEKRNAPIQGGIENSKIRNALMNDEGHLYKEENFNGKRM